MILYCDTSALIKRYVEEGRYPLKGFDSIHLSSASILKDLNENDLYFACFDHNLNNAAMCEGFDIIKFS